MTTVKVKFYNDGNKRWFDGEKINEGYDKQDFPHLYKEDGTRRENIEEESYDSEKEA